MTDAGICHTGTFGAPALLSTLATISEEVDPSLSADELTLYFGSNRNGGQQRAIWTATRAAKTDPFGTPTLVSELDSAQDDGEPAISRDGLTIYFHSDRSGTMQIYVGTRATTTDPFTVQLLPIANAGATVVTPAVSPDQLTLYFSNNALEVAVATRPDGASPFTFVREIDEVNQPPTDSSPAISADGLELYFDSYRNGPAAIFVATRATTADLFSAPTELTSLPAGNAAAGSPELSADGRTLYYFIDDGAQLDLYSATRDCL